MVIDKFRQMITQALNHLSSLFNLKEASEDDADSEDASQKESKPVWCLIANVVEERKFGEGGEEVRRGLKQLQPGAKVHCFPLMWGDGYDNVQVVARHRKSHRYMTIIVPSRHLTNWRVRLIYSPEVIGRLEGRWDGSEKSKKEAENLRDWMNQRQSKL